MSPPAPSAKLPSFNGPSALIILDGCGNGEEEAYNCVALARTPFLDNLRSGQCDIPGCPGSRTLPRWRPEDLRALQ